MTRAPREKVYVVYRITHKTSGKKYIGQSFDVERRWREHKNARNLISENNNNKSWSSLVHNAIAKYGAEDFIFEIVEECTAETICDREIHHIEVNDCLHPNGYNLLKGGRGTCGGHHAESRKRMSESHKGKIITDITKARMSAARMGDKNPAFGGDGTFVKAVAQYDLSGNFIKSFPSCAAAAKDMSEIGAKGGVIASASRGAHQTAYNYQWRQQDETTLAFPPTINAHIPGKFMNRKPVVGIDSNGLETIYTSVQDAAQVVGVKPANISAALKDTHRRTKGLRWRFFPVVYPKVRRENIKTGEVIIYDSLKDAAASIGLISSIIRPFLNQKPTRGYKWTQIND